MSKVELISTEKHLAVFDTETRIIRIQQKLHGFADGGPVKSTPQRFQAEVTIPADDLLRVTQKLTSIVLGEHGFGMFQEGLNAPRRINHGCPVHGDQRDMSDPEECICVVGHEDDEDEDPNSEHERNYQRDISQSLKQHRG